MFASAAETDDKCLNGDNPLLWGFHKLKCAISKKDLETIARVNQRLRMQYASTADGESKVNSLIRESLQNLKGASQVAVACFLTIRFWSLIPVENKIFPVAVSRLKTLLEGKLPSLRSHVNAWCVHLFNYMGNFHKTSKANML